VCVCGGGGFITAVPITKLFAGGGGVERLQDLLQSCSRGGRRVEDMCYDVYCSYTVCVLLVQLLCVCVLLLQDLLQSCARGGRRRVEDMCYERRRAEACVDESAHHALVNAGGREIV
jgi:hypothetical protein